MWMHNHNADPSGFSYEETCVKWFYDFVCNKYKRNVLFYGDWSKSSRFDPMAFLLGDFVRYGILSDGKSTSRFNEVVNFVRIY